MRGTVSRTLLLKDVFVPDSGQLMPRGIYHQAASRWPHMFSTLSPTYMGIAVAAYEFTVRYLRGEIEGMGPPVKRRMHPTKQIATAQMHILLEQTRSIFLRSFGEARIDPPKEMRLRAYAAHYTDHGERQRDRPARDPHLRRPVDAQEPAARAALPRFALRQPDAAVDGGTVPRPDRPRGALRTRRG